MISLIAAIGKNNELGKGNTLLWHLPADMKYFRDTTRGHPVIMGRKTFESIGRPLPDRRNVIVTRDRDYKKDGIEIVYSLDEALELFKDSDEEVFVIGGGEIYKQALPFTDKLYITHVEAEDPEADAFFPEIPSDWRETSKESHSADELNAFNYSFTEYQKRLSD